MDMTEFVLHCNGRILSLLMRKTRNPHTAEDLCQNVLLKCWLYFQREGHIPPFAWTMRVTLNEYNSWRRKRTPQLLPPRLLPDGFDLVTDPARTIQEKEQAPIVLALLALPPLYRDIARLHYVDGWTILRIAQDRCIPVNTAKTRILRAKSLLVAKLRRFLSN